MQYNTQRPTLIMPEYGRGIQDMVEMAIGLPTKIERERCARAIVSIMARISRYQLDIDYPVEIVSEEEVYAHPEPLPYPMKKIRSRHYGHLIESSLEYARTLPDGEEKDTLVAMVANQMKQNLFIWNRDSMDDSLVASDIARFTHGEIHLDLKQHRFAAVGYLDQQNYGNAQRKKFRTTNHTMPNNTANDQNGILVSNACQHQPSRG